MAKAKGGAEATPPPRSGKYRDGGPMKSAQGVYPIISDDATTFAFVEFVRNRGSAIL